MSERGVFAVDRGVWHHPMFADEPFTEREAWLWMVSAAAWMTKRVRVGKAMIHLDRGQLAFSTRFLATRWKWAHSKVVRFLKRLETDTMVSTSATRDATLITICNYDKYAFGRNAVETPAGTQADTLPERSRNKEEELKKDNNQELKTDRRKRAEPRRATRLPADAVASDRNISDATSLGMTIPEIEQQWRRMRDWSASAPKGACLDWDARWRNWCETFLGGRNGNGTSYHRTNQTSGPAPTRDIAIATGMDRALERRRAARNPDDGGRSEFREGRGPGAAAGDDAEPGTAAGDGGPHQQLALLSSTNTG